MKLAQDIIKRPIITEKSMNLAEQGKYVFEVVKGANKVEIKKAVEEIFGVKVESVNTVSAVKKAKRVGKYSGFKSDVRKAIVTLKAGETIKAFQI